MSPNEDTEAEIPERQLTAIHIRREYKNKAQRYVRAIARKLPEEGRAKALRALPVVAAAGVPKNRAHFMSGETIVFIVNLKKGTTEWVQ